MKRTVSSSDPERERVLRIVRKYRSDPSVLMAQGTKAEVKALFLYAAREANEAQRKVAGLK